MRYPLPSNRSDTGLADDFHCPGNMQSSTSGRFLLCSRHSDSMGLIYSRIMIRVGTVLPARALDLLVRVTCISRRHGRWPLTRSRPRRHGLRSRKSVSCFCLAGEDDCGVVCAGDFVH